MVTSIYFMEIIVLLLLLSVMAYTLSKSFNIPIIVFLLLEGIIAGPEVLNMLDPAVFGNGLTVIVSLSVAIIVFDGGLHIDLRHIRTVQQSVLRLISVGVLVTFILTTFVTHMLLSVPLELAALFGALISATGPTVITPMVKQVRPNHKISKVLELEGVLNDAGSVILAALIFEWIVSQLSGFEVLSFILFRIFIGVVFGISSGFLLSRFLSMESLITDQTTRIVTITMVLATFVIAEIFGNESGIMAVAIFGIYVGSSNVPNKSVIKEFKADIVIILLSFIFLILASMLRFEDIVNIGFKGFAIVILLMFFIRPLAVFISTLKSKLTLKDKLFISFIGPRGIVPASIATYFTIKLNNMGIIGGEFLVGLVFLAVIISVVTTGFLSKRVAKFLGVIPMEILVVGGGEVGKILAERFEKRGENVVVVDPSEENCQKLMKSDIRVVHGDAEDINVLKEAGIDHAKYVVATTDKDNTNLLICQIAKTKFNFDKDQIVARVNNIENLHAFWDLEIRAMSPAMTTALVLDNMVGRPHMFSMCEVGEGADIIEAHISNPKVVGKAISELKLPESSLLLMVRRGNESFIANGNVVLEYDDIVTVIGEGDSAQKVADLFER
ncbi:cation:proton antiporter domain-containing protein [Methanohalophilus portucalensis]|uniref:Sodium/proton antiporter, CPA1 family n=3 Tax=Methanohalophilus portucalensis TaxID=39664 RepID=A0A1X7NKX3_9EURY|nr:cation:proton antiporter [Methanohalophilus portucalensis]ATU07556.1 sodium:proton antiporter [Methanohalophilus portucalensis]RNI10282.1 sodium:proton antiporter [Methanohalophilus portucalensis FDF-1]SMH38115.1 sodium/proton antiporter, CPA1 family [Methanohalophilus portucalensis FDF-1]